MGFNTILGKVKYRIIVALFLAFAIVLSSHQDSYAWDTYEEQSLFEDLIGQGYSREVATDEVWERKGKPDVYGTGGIDGISTYGTCDFGGGGGTIATQPKSSTKTHTHLWGRGEIVKEATCLEEGIMEYACQCGEKLTGTIEKTDHTYESEEVPATCVNYRRTVYTCSVCGDTYAVEYPDDGYADHVYSPSEDSIEATCDEKGLIKYVCNVCGDSYEEEVDALGHEFTSYKIDVEPNCLSEGEKSIYCDRCGVKKEGSTVKISALGHTENPSHEVVQPTFWREGKEITYCLTCGDIMAEAAIPAKGGAFTIIIPSIACLILVLFPLILLVKKKRK